MSDMLDATSSLRQEHNAKVLTGPRVWAITLSRVRAQLLRACVGQGFSREVAPEVIP